MLSTTKTAKRLEELKNYANVGDEYLVEEIINFKNELKEIMDWDDINNVPMEIDVEKISLLIQEIESLEAR